MTAQVFDIDALREAGFCGFRPLLPLDTASAPADAGVYVVLTQDVAPPRFLATSVGGHFKQKDPSVDVATLHVNWVQGAPVLYVGKATSLRTRLRQFRDFGQGRPVGHWGGRLIWQLENHADLLVCWQPTTVDPRSVEQTLLSTFKKHYGHLPFANLRH